MRNNPEEQFTENTVQSSERRFARIAKHNQDPVGVCIFLTNAQLRKLGVSIDSAEAVGYQLVEDGSNFVLKITGIKNLSAIDFHSSTTD